MKKVKVSIKVNDYLINDIGILENGILKVKDKETDVEFNTKDLVLTRKNKDITINIDFKNSTMTYNIPETNKKFLDKITILSLTNNDKEYNIMYQMSDDTFILKIKYENEE